MTWAALTELISTALLGGIVLGLVLHVLTLVARSGRRR